jgi:hypothetical protein
MTYHAALEYITAARACGLDDHAVKDRLQTAGWMAVDVEDAFALLEKMDGAAARHAAICPPDHGEQAPMPTTTSHLLAQVTASSTGRTSLWFVALGGLFMLGYFLMR